MAERHERSTATLGAVPAPSGYATAIRTDAALSSVRDSRNTRCGSTVLTSTYSPEAIPVSVRDRLAADYPHDRAVGYRIGEIRGGVTIKQRLP